MKTAHLVLLVIDASLSTIQFSNMSVLPIQFSPTPMSATLLETKNASFLCRGFSCNGPGGILKCPDNKTQSRERTGSAGGNVFVTTIKAQRLVDRDGKAIPDAGIARLSDPYVRVRVGTEGRWSTKETNRIGNRENARWGKHGEKLHMGWHRAGEARMHIEVFDYDTGVEVINGRDDSLGTVSLWLPFCSSLTANYDNLECDENICAAFDSSWTISNRQRCHEEGWLLLNNGLYTIMASQACCEMDDASCIHLAIDIVPFQLFVDNVFSEQDVDLSLFADPEIDYAGEIPANGFGQPYVGEGVQYTVDGANSPLDASGAILLRTTASDGYLKLTGDTVHLSSQYMRLSVNTKATVTLCRLVDCDPLPEWLEDWDYVVKITVLNVSEEVQYACYQQIFGSTTRSLYRTIESNAISLKWAECPQNYFVVVEPHLGVLMQKSGRKYVLERVTFFIRLLQLGIPVLILLPGNLKYLRPTGLTHLCHFCKLELSMLYVTLLIGDGASVHNREFQHNYYWSCSCTTFAFIIPYIFFGTCGFTIFLTVEPENVGACMIFFGTAIFMWLNALAQWRLEGWRLTRKSVGSLTLSIGSTLVFLVVAVLNYPERSRQQNRDINFVAFTMAFLTFELIPLVLEAIESNSRLCEAKNSAAIALAIAAGCSVNDKEDYWLMKHCYSASSDCQHFDFVPDIAGNLCGLNNHVDSVEIASSRSALLRAGTRFLLLVYVVGAFLLTSKGYLAVAIVVFLSLTDCINMCLDWGSTGWSASKVVFLFVVTRVLIIVGGTRLWIIGFSTAYCAYGFLLFADIVNKYLPRLSHDTSCAIVFLRNGTDRRLNVSSPYNVAGSPELVLVALTVMLWTVLFVAGYSKLPGLPLPYIHLSPRVQIPSQCCPIIAFLLVSCYATTFGCVRVDYLTAQNFVSYGAKGTYIVAPWFDLTKILASLASLFVVFVGLILWGESNTLSPLAILTIGSPCVYCTYHAGSTWIENGCQLVLWPPLQQQSAEENVHISESKLAFNMLKAMMGGVLAHDATLGKLGVPQLVTACTYESESRATIDMPTLPSGSTMSLHLAGSEYSRIGRAVESLATRRQIVDLGLRAKRAGKCKSPSKETKSALARKRKQSNIPSLTVKEINVHLSGLLLHHCLGIASHAKVANESLQASPPIMTKDTRVDLAWLHVPLWEAILTGCLLRREYTALICATSAPLCGLVLGGLLAFLAHPQKVVGHLLWVTFLSLFCTTYPIFIWGVTCAVTRGAVLTSMFGWSAFVGIWGWTFCAWLGLRIDVVETLWILDILIIYTLALGGTYRIMPWIDSLLFVKSKGKPTWMRTTRGHQSAVKQSPSLQRLLQGAYLSLLQLAIGFMCLSLIVQVYMSGHMYGAFILYLLAAGLWVGSRFMLSWAKTEFYVSPRVMLSLDQSFLYASTVAAATFLALQGASAGTALSIFFALRLFKCIAQIIGRILHVESDAIFWFAPLLLPSYSYSAHKALLVDETRLVIHCTSFFGIGLCWGVVLVCLNLPISLGIGLCFVFILFALVIATYVCTLVSIKMGTATRHLPTSILVDAETLAQGKFAGAIYSKRSKYEAACDEYQNAHSQSVNVSNHTVHGSLEVSTKDTSEIRFSACEIAIKIDAAECSLRLCAIDGSAPIWRADAFYTCVDGFAETCASHGPFGNLSHLARLFRPRLLRHSATNFDREGRRITMEVPAELEATQAILHMHELEESFTKRFELEMQALIYFQFIVITATQTYFIQQHIRLEKFLREKRFRLHSNGIFPPRVTGNYSFAAVDMRHVASWLTYLDEEHCEQFHLLRDNFNAEQTDCEVKIDQHNIDEAAAAGKLARERIARERVMYAKWLNDCVIRRSKRTETWTASLSLAERERFIDVLQTKWEAKSFCSIDPIDRTLRKSYEAHVLLNDEETVGNCRACLAELEAGGFNCYPSKTRKGALQFVDSEFPSGPGAFGACSGAEFVDTWNNALSINPHAMLFTDGSDPDDVRPGACVNDEWLLAAISILSAAGGMDEVNIENHIKRLFIHMVDDDGNMVYDSAVGAFGLKLFVNGQWEATIVDDTFPMLGDGSSKDGVDALIAIRVSETAKSANSLQCGHYGIKQHPKSPSSMPHTHSIELYMQHYKDCAGFAISCVAEMSELWVSLLEKGIAKYYGSYAAIEAGFVHQGLEVLTGYHSQCHHIAQPSRGIGKAALWGSLLRNSQNEHILGAGALPAEQASSVLHVSGLLFGGTYTIYDIVDVVSKGLKLVKLRGPSGHTEVFRGVWVRTSLLWTQRLRYELECFQEPHTFWMSFDEFCCFFRCIFVCHYYSDRSVSWQRQSISGEWICMPEIQLCSQPNPDYNRKHTAAGLPSSYNPSCEVERNPQYAIIVHRPITLRFIINQRDANGAHMLPIAGYLCRAHAAGYIDTCNVDRITKLGNHNIITTTGKARRETAVQAHIDNLTAGAYVLLVGTFRAKMEGHFTLTTISNHEIELTQIWPPIWG